MASDLPTGSPSARDASGRRVKVLSYSGMELWDMFRPLLQERLVQGPAVFMASLRLGKQAARRGKLLALGFGPTCVRLHRTGRQRARVFAAGLTAGRFAVRLGVAHRVLHRSFAVGSMLLDARMRVAVEMGLLPAEGLAGCPSYSAHPHGIRTMYASAMKRKKRTISTAGRRKGGKGGKSAADESFDGVKTRGVHWDAISDVEGTMWDRGGASAALALSPDLPRRTSVIDAGKLVPSLEDVFAANKTAKKPTAGGAGGPRKPKTIMLLDGKAQRNISIGVRGTLKGNPDLSKVADAIRRMDAAALGGADAVAALAELEAYSEENMAPVRAFTGDASKLGVAEKYIKEVVLAVSEPKARLKVMEFMHTMDDIKAAAVDKAESLLDACEEIMGSKRFKTLLADVMLPLGNRLNAGSKKGQAAGIKMSSLNKLINTRAATGETFLRFIVDGLLEMDGDEPGMTVQLLDLDDDMPTILKVKHATMSPAIIELDVGRLMKGASQTEALYNKAKEAGDRQLASMLEHAVSDAKEAHQDAGTKMYAAVEAFGKLCQFLGEDKGKSSPEGIFGYVARFVQQVKGEKRAAEARQERKRKEEERKRSKDHIKALQSGSTAHGKKVPAPPPGQAVAVKPAEAVEKLPPKPGSKPKPPPKPAGPKPGAAKPKAKPRRQSVLGGIGPQAPSQDEEKEMVDQVQNKMIAKFKRASMAFIAAGTIKDAGSFFAKEEAEGGAAAGGLDSLGEEEEEDEEDEEDGVN